MGDVVWMELVVLVWGEDGVVEGEDIERSDWGNDGDNGWDEGGVVEGGGEDLMF